MAHRAFCCCLFAVGTCANAQVVVDNSFGNTGSLSGPNFKIPDTLGKTVGDNLFHSFNEFSLQTGQSATFTGPDSIQNILGRVTGNKVSEIDGLIQSEITDANLYLLNPSGFLFGKNAKVDVDGAFTVSTRESLKLGDEGSFNAVNPEQSVFTSAAPDAFGFLGENPGGAIKFSGSKLIVENPVGLVGGDIKLEDSVIYAKSEGKATGVRIEGNNLGIVDCQIRNKSTAGVERREIMKLPLITSPHDQTASYRSVLLLPDLSLRSHAKVRSRSGHPGAFHQRLPLGSHQHSVQC